MLPNMHLPMKEIVVMLVTKSRWKLMTNSALIGGNPQYILDWQLSPRPVHFLNLIVIVVLFNFIRSYIILLRTILSDCRNAHPQKIFFFCWHSYQLNQRAHVPLNFKDIKVFHWTCEILDSVVRIEVTVYTERTNMRCQGMACTKSFDIRLTSAEGHNLKCLKQKIIFLKVHLVNALSSKPMPVFYITQALSMCILKSGV
jgi:hypothetical protein